MSIIRKQYIRRKCDPVEAERMWAARGGVKPCSKCGRTRKRDQYKPSTKAKDGASSECRGCRNAHDRAKRYASGRLSKAEFFARRTPADYSEAVWRRAEERNAREAWQWWLANAPEWWVRARDSAAKARSVELDRANWRAAKHIKRAKARGVTYDQITSAELNAIRNSGECYWCGGKTTQYDGVEWKATDATIEHIVPLSEGGGHTWDNVACACAACNFGRGDSNWGRVIAA